jgi:hypothetical protein
MQYNKVIKLHRSGRNTASAMKKFDEADKAAHISSTGERKNNEVTDSIESLYDSMDFMEKRAKLDPLRHRVIERIRKAKINISRDGPCYIVTDNFQFTWNRYNKTVKKLRYAQ